MRCFAFLYVLAIIAGWCLSEFTGLPLGFTALGTTSLAAAWSIADAILQMDLKLKKDLPEYFS